MHWRCTLLSLERNWAKRGCNELARCLLKCVEIQIEANCKSFSFVSDNCSWQNGSRFIATLWWYLIKQLGVADVTHSFLEVGHTQNENDSVYSNIERVSRRSSLYTPDQWAAVIGTPRSNKPYVTTNMELEDFYDFKHLRSKCFRNFEVDEEGKKVKWSQIRSMEFSSKNPDKMFIRYAYGKDTICVNLMSGGKNTRRSVTVHPQLIVLWTTAIPVPAAKFADLMKLCDKQLIPRRHQGFFRSFHTNRKKWTVDRIASCSIAIQFRFFQCEISTFYRTIMFLSVF